MRILLCHNFYREPGGEDQVFADEGWLLESHGHDVIRYTRHNDDLESMGRWEAARRTLWNRQTREEVYRLIRQEQPDLLHCHNTFPLISPSIYAAAKVAGVPVVQTLHNYRLLCPSALFLRDGRPCEDCLGKLLAWPGIVHRCYRRNRLATAVVAAMLAAHRLRGTWVRRVQQFIALSEFSRGKFIEGGLPARRVTVKANFMRHDPCCGSGRGGYAVFVGRLAAEKGVGTLLAAWQQLAGYVPLKIMGDGPLAADAAAAARQDPRIEYLGRRGGDEVLAILGEAACLVFPSTCYENCPKTILEAFAKGTPVIASAAGAMTEMVADGRNGFHFRPGDSQDLAAKVGALLADPGRSSAMRRAARDDYEVKYRSEVNAQRLLAIYRQALADFHPTRPEPVACTSEVCL
ncbi:MAG: glycosyltransferase family 4 protein [Thermoguttaceae bacterium]